MITPPANLNRWLWVWGTTCSSRWCLDSTDITQEEGVEGVAAWCAGTCEWEGAASGVELQVVFSTEHPAGLKKAGCSAGIAVTVSPQGASKTKRDFFTFFFGWFGCLFWGVFLHPPVLPLTAPQIPESRSTFRSAGHQPRLGCQGLAVWAHGWGCSLLHSPLQSRAELESQGCRLAQEGIVPLKDTFLNSKPKTLLCDSFKAWWSSLFPTSAGKSPLTSPYTRCKWTLCSSTLLSLLISCLPWCDWLVKKVGKQTAFQLKCSFHQEYSQLDRCCQRLTLLCCLCKVMELIQWKGYCPTYLLFKLLANLKAVSWSF